MKRAEYEHDPNCLEFWRANTERFSKMARVAKKHTPISASSTPSEKVFSLMKHEMLDARSSMDHKTLSSIIQLVKFINDMN